MNTESAPSANMKIVLPLMAIFFLAVLVLMIWWLEFSWRSSFEPRAITFRGSELNVNVKTILNRENKPLLMHFILPGCQCNRFSEEHKDHLEILLGKHVQNVEVYLNAPPSNPAIDDALEQALIKWAPAAPATAIWTGSGELAYFGPYSDGSVCGRGKDLVISTLQSLLKGQNPSWINQEAFGCFCTPDKAKKSTLPANTVKN